MSKIKQFFWHNTFGYIITLLLAAVFGGLVGKLVGFLVFRVIFA